MAQQTTRISEDLLDEPHIAGRRIPVLTIAERVEGRDLDAATVAERHDLDVADVYAALLYFHEHPEEFEAVRREREAVMADVEVDIDRPEDVSPGT
ncbi:DUF433 domain-containing protein [Halapricum sp. CBA1109]|uniref:DUF433 domain-containing protein n=1 Tax=Halapricum sp. CBA1109 TaxID=2668068 RepID=UPI0012F792C3|nr:DUF433 domain-containing protein [Halapricum sp. CBA1109]MUV89125.1 DUF433 domain-containing protein [Halapricum sp. CBA1109]